MHRHFAGFKVLKIMHSLALTVLHMVVVLVFMMVLEQGTTHYGRAKLPSMTLIEMGH